MENAAMQSGTCPKCQARAVHAKNEGISVRTRSLSIWINMFRRAYLRAYVCTNCGYTEQYVIGQEALQGIARKWPRVE
jgi:predicted nucleic-acid-binding Zn-ribbon protein